MDTAPTSGAHGAAGLPPMVAARVRAAREARGLSLSAVAAAAGIGKGSLSEIEHGTRNPTLSTLYALAHALATPLSTLLAETTGAEVASPGIVARLLDVREEPGFTVEVFHLSLAPGAEHRSAAHGAGVSEQVLVTGGRLRVGAVGAAQEVGPGDVATFAADGPHAYEAVGGAAHAINVIRTPR
ncbi:helix-turn-helix domain-containing protein [Demequina sp. NBRC 110055]|uniref:helix-turn-helix domain-containing protein n=1 Tax=Demequina sp. NBRC 110055 TaxID=1570344 RepID=UPI00190F06CA|nr:XRE family transcriptional regulator [Demequina sp. NBRC 110055]